MSIRESRVSRRKGWKRSALALAAPLVAVMSVGAVASSLTNASAAVAMPDLVVTSIAKPTATAGGPVQFSATVKNQGTAATPAGVIIGVQFQVDAKSAFTWSDTDKTSLAPGASVTLTANGGQAGASWTATTGTHSVRAYVDDVNRIGESNEANNILTSPFTTSAAAPIPPAMPDLVVTGMTPPTATAGGPVQFAATVKNQGTAATPAGVIIGVQFQVDAKSAFTWSDTDKTSLAAGASVTLTANGGQSGATWTATAGTHTVRALVDDINRIAEANETNNAYTLTYTTSVAAPPPTTVPPTVPPTTTPPTTVPLPPPTGTAKGDRFGFTQYYNAFFNTAAFDRSIPLIAASGSKWVRFDFVWSAIETSRGVYNWAKLDHAVNLATLYGLKIEGTLFSTPGWARANQATDHAPPDNPATMAEFAAAVTARYPRSQVPLLEVWNEPNLTGFWTPKANGVDYARLVAAVNAAAHAADPKVTVLAGALAFHGGNDAAGTPPTTFIQQMYAGGLKGNFDAISIHPYGVPGLAYALGQLDQAHTIMVTNGDGNKPIWSTEAGQSTCGITEAQQAQTYQDYVTNWTSGARPWLTAVFFHTLQNRTDTTDCNERNFGALRDDWSPKPSYTTLKNGIS